MQAKGIPARDPEGLTRAVQEYNQHSIKYLREYPETYASPERTLEWGVGDCDDQVILTCAALRGVKIPCRAVFVGWAPKGSVGLIKLRHVYPEVWLDKWVAAEAVKPVPLGWAIDVEKAKQGFRTRRVAVGDPPGPFRGDDGTGIDFGVNVADDRARAIGQQFGNGVAISDLPPRLSAALSIGIDPARKTLRNLGWALAGGLVTAALIRARP